MKKVLFSYFTDEKTGYREGRQCPQGHTASNEMALAHNTAWDHHTPTYLLPSNILPMLQIEQYNSKVND